MPRRKRTPSLSPEKLAKIDEAEREIDRAIAKHEADIERWQNNIRLHEAVLAKLRQERERISGKRG